MPDFYLYILKCGDGSYYIGHTDDIDKRLNEHLQGAGSAYTRRRQPVEVIYAEAFMNRCDAFEAERRLKGWSRKKKEAFMRGDWETIKKLSNNK